MRAIEGKVFDNYHKLLFYKDLGSIDISVKFKPFFVDFRRHVQREAENTAPDLIISMGDSFFEVVVCF